LEDQNVRFLDFPTVVDLQTNNVEQTQLEGQMMRDLDIPTAVVPDVHDATNTSSPSLVQMFVKTHNTQAQRLAVTDVNILTVQQVHQGEHLVT